MKTSPNFSEDAVPISDLKVNPGKVLRKVDETRRPVLLTSRGRGVAVVQSVREYEAGSEGRDFQKGGRIRRVCGPRHGRNSRLVSRTTGSRGGKKTGSRDLHRCGAPSGFPGKRPDRSGAQRREYPGADSPAVPDRLPH